MKYGMVYCTEILICVVISTPEKENEPHTLEHYERMNIERSNEIRYRTRCLSNSSWSWFFVIFFFHSTSFCITASITIRVILIYSYFYPSIHFNVFVGMCNVLVRKRNFIVDNIIYRVNRNHFPLFSHLFFHQILHGSELRIESRQFRVKCIGFPNVCLTC